MNDSASHPLFLSYSSLLSLLSISLSCCSSRTWCSRRVAILALSFLSYSNNYGTMPISLALLQPIMNPRYPSRTALCLGVSLLIRHFGNIQMQAYVLTSIRHLHTIFCLYLAIWRTSMRSMDGWIRIIDAGDTSLRAGVGDCSHWLGEGCFPRGQETRYVKPLLIFLALIPSHDPSTFSAASNPQGLIRVRQSCLYMDKNEESLRPSK